MHLVEYKPQQAVNILKFFNTYEGVTKLIKRQYVKVNNLRLLISKFNVFWLSKI